MDALHQRVSWRLLARLLWLLVLGASALPLPFVSAQSPEAPEPLTARLEMLPTWHGGSSFSFELHFSAPPQLSYVNVRDHLFEVENGDVRRARRIEKGSNLSWQVFVSPSGFDDITITLPETSTCGEASSVCTGGGQQLETSLTAEIPGPGDRLAARITTLPSSHHGWSFQAELVFNHEPRLSYRKLRDRLLDVHAGDVKRAKRNTKGDNTAWTLTIKPDGRGTVAIALPVTVSCSEPDAICTRDGRPLEDGVYRSVRGPDRDHAPSRPSNRMREVETQPAVTSQAPAMSQLAPAQTEPPARTAPPVLTEPPALTEAGPTGQVGGVDLPEIPDMVFTAVSCPCGIKPVTLPEATGGTIYAYILSTLPEGLEWDPDTFTISGTPDPEAVGEHELSFLALGFTGSDSKEFTITINPELDVGNPPDQEYEVGQPIEPLQLEEASGGTEPLDYDLDGPELGGDELPPGLSWDKATRTIFGTPSEEADRRMIYRVTDATYEVDGNKVYGAYTTKTFQIRVVERAPAVTKGTVVPGGGLAPGDGVVEGSLLFADGTGVDDLPQGATIIVTLADTSKAGGIYTVIAQQRCTVGVGTCSGDFALTYDADTIDPRNEYSLIAKIYHQEGRLLYINDTVHTVITSPFSFMNNPEDRDVEVVPVS